MGIDPKLISNLKSKIEFNPTTWQLLKGASMRIRLARNLELGGKLKDTVAPSVLISLISTFLVCSIGGIFLLYLSFGGNWGWEIDDHATFVFAVVLLCIVALVIIALVSCMVDYRGEYTLRRFNRQYEVLRNPPEPFDAHLGLDSFILYFSPGGLNMNIIQVFLPDDTGLRMFEDFVTYGPAKDISYGHKKLKVTFKDNTVKQYDSRHKQDLDFITVLFENHHDHIRKKYKGGRWQLKGLNEYRFEELNKVQKWMNSRNDYFFSQYLEIGPRFYESKECQDFLQKLERILYQLLMNPRKKLTPKDSFTYLDPRLGDVDVPDGTRWVDVVMFNEVKLDDPEYVEKLEDRKWRYRRKYPGGSGGVPLETVAKFLRRPPMD